MHHVDQLLSMLQLSFPRFSPPFEVGFAKDPKKRPQWIPWVDFPWFPIDLWAKTLDFPSSYGPKIADSWWFRQVWYLVGGIPVPQKNMSSSTGMMKILIYGKIKHVSNHQPDIKCFWPLNDRFMTHSHIITLHYPPGMDEKSSGRAPKSASTTRSAPKPEAQRP